MEYVIALAALTALLVAANLVQKRGPPRPRKARRRNRDPTGYLDTPLLEFGGLAWKIRDCCTGVLCLGQTGSGKTTGPMAALVAALLRVGGLLVVCSKEDDASRMLAAARRVGRSGDVIRVHAGPGSHSINFLDCVLAGVEADDATLATLAASAFEQFMEVASRAKRGGGENDAFWKQQAERMTRSAFHLMLLAGERCSVGGLLRVVQSLPASPEDLTSEAWRARPLNQLLRAAYGRRHGREAEFQELSDYFLGEMSQLSGKTKSVVQATVAGVADAVSRGMVGRLLAGKTTFDLARAIEHRGIVIVDVGAEYGELARLVAVGFKAMVQQQVLRRKIAPDSKLFALVLDEFQCCVTKADWGYASRSRQYRGPIIAATQGIETLRAELGGDQAKDEVDALASNLGTKIIALPTWPTATWACEMIGKTRTRMHGGSASAGVYRDPTDFVFQQQQSSASGSFSEVFELELRPEELLAGMRSGGPDHDYLVDALVVQPGKRFADTGSQYTFVTFEQQRGS